MDGVLKKVLTGVNVTKRPIIEELVLYQEGRTDVCDMTDDAVDR